MTNISSSVKVMLDITAKASRFLSRDYYELKSLQSSKNSTQTFVDRCLDKMSKVIVNELERSRPEYGVSALGIEKESQNEEKSKWLVNIMSGERNLSHAIPCIGMSIAIEEEIYGKKELVASLICFPILDETYFAEKGKGSWFIGSMGQHGATSRLRVSERRNADSLLIISHNDRAAEKDSVRDFGCDLLSCAYVASGRADIAKIDGSSYHDVAAGILLIQEAGGMVQNDSGNSMIISNSHLGNSRK